MRERLAIMRRTFITTLCRICFRALGVTEYGSLHGSCFHGFDLLTYYNMKIINGYIIYFMHGVKQGCNKHFVNKKKSNIKKSASQANYCQGFTTHQKISLNFNINSIFTT